jgi:type III restriction enzyme
MAGIKKFDTKDLVLCVNTKNFDPVKYPLQDWWRFLDVLCSTRDYQKEAIRTSIHYLISTKYQSINDLISDNYSNNDQLRLRYNTPDAYFSKLQLPKKRSGTIDLATGTGKSYVMYGIAQIALGLGIVDKVLLLGPPSLTIERELTKKFTGLSADKTLKNAVPISSKCSNPSIIDATQTINDACICIENINAVYARTGSSILNSLGFGKGSRCLVLCDEVHHAYNKVDRNTAESKSIKKWKEFLLDQTYSFNYILGFTGTAYIENEYFNDVLYRYSLRSAIEQGFVKNVDYVVENIDANEDEKFQKILQNHIRNKNLYPNLKPLTILVTKDIKNAKQLKTRLVEFLAGKQQGSEADLNENKVLIVTSDKEHKANVLELPYVDSSENAVEWIISVAMLTEGWDVKNVFQIVPMEEKAFNSKLLIAQVLGRGLRIPENYPKAEVVVFNHDKWSSQIEELVKAILETEAKVKNSPITEGERAKYHFTLYNINYMKIQSETLIEKNTEIYDYKDFFKFAAESFEQHPETKYKKFGDKEYSITYNIEKEKFPVRNENGKEGIAEKVYKDFQVRKLEGIIFKLDKNAYTNENLPDIGAIERQIRRSMDKVGIEGNYLGKNNRQVVFSAFGTLLRKKPKSVLVKRIPDCTKLISTRDREHESVSILGLKNGSSIFYSANYKQEIVDEDSLLAFEEILTDESLPRAACGSSIIPLLFKTPINLVFTSRDPERAFVKELIKKENAEKMTSWIKSHSQSFYSIEYSYKQGTHASSRDFNPDFFILLTENDYKYISVVEIKSDDDDSDENKQKYIYATKHFSELNKQLETGNINEKYFFNFVSPKNYSDYFTYLRDGRLIQDLYRSELDRLLEKK